MSRDAEVKNEIHYQMIHYKTFRNVDNYFDTAMRTTSRRKYVSMTSQLYPTNLHCRTNEFSENLKF